MNIQSPAKWEPKALAIFAKTLTLLLERITQGVRPEEDTNELLSLRKKLLMTINR